MSIANSGLFLVCIFKKYLFPPPPFQSVCVPRFEVDLLQTAYIGFFVFFFGGGVSIQPVFVFWLEHLTHLHLW